MIALLAALLVAMEFARRLRPLAALRAMTSASLRARRAVTRRGADRWKERLMQGVSLRMLKASVVAGLVLLAVIAPVAVVLVLDPILDLGAVAALFDWTSRIVIATVIVAYAILRSRLAALRTR